MGVPSEPSGSSDQNMPESYYEELQVAGWVDGPGRLPDHITPNEHFAVIYGDQAEYETFTLQFIADGIESGAPCLYVTAERTQNEILADLRGGEFDLTETDPSDHVSVRTIAEFVGDDGIDSTEELLTAFQRTVSARSRPEHKTRVVVEMAGLLDVVPFQTLLEYESRLNRLCRKNDVIVLSQYRRNQTAPELLSELLAVYPYIVIDETVCYNPEYLPPSTFLSQKRADHEVQQAIETLRHQTETQLELTEKRQRNEQLKVFANSIAHDLRNPLQTAIGRTELLPENEEQVEVVRDALDRMERLIDDGLEMVLGDDLAASEPVSIENIATQCWTMTDVADASLSIVEDFSITGDRGRIQQLFENLFQNSIEYGGPSPTIRVGPIEQIHLATRANTDADYTGFYIEDDGPGIPEDRRDKIFDLGVSGGNGTGYGLAIVKEIVEAHDWQIHVTAGTDGGARFEITGVDVSPP